MVCDLIGLPAVSATGNLGHLSWLPHTRTLNQIVQVEDGTAVRDGMIGGRFVEREGRLLTLDLAKLARGGSRARAPGAANAPMRLLSETLQDAVVASFCAGLARQPRQVERYRAPLR